MVFETFDSCLMIVGWCAEDILPWGNVGQLELVPLRSAGDLGGSFFILCSIFPRKPTLRRGGCVLFLIFNRSSPVSLHPPSIKDPAEASLIIISITKEQAQALGRGPLSVREFSSAYFFLPKSHK